MSFDELMRRREVRTWLPWALFAIAALAALPLGLGASGLGVAPAVAEVRAASLSSPGAARVLEVLVAPGEAVAEGQVLVRLDPRDVELQLAIARAELKRLELEISSQEVALRDDRAETASRLAAEAERAALDVTQLAAQEQRDRAELAQLDQQVAREQGLVDEGLASAEKLNGLRLRHAALSKQVEEAAQTIRQARFLASGTSRRLDEWSDAAHGSATPAGSRIDRQVAPRRAAADAQRERLHQLELLRGRLELAAPFAGRVGAVLLRPGEVAGEGVPVVTVVDDRPVNAIAYPDQRWAVRIRIGDRVELHPSDRSGPPRTGRVVALGSAITELPVRFRHFPTEPAFGREVFIRFDTPATLPGQAFDATFERGDGR